GEALVLYQDMQPGGVVGEKIFQARRFTGQVETAENPAQAAIAGRLGNEGNAMRLFLPQARPKQRTHTKTLGFFHERDGAVKVVGIGQRKRCIAACRRTLQQARKTAGAFEKGIPAMSVQGDRHKSTIKQLSSGEFACLLCVHLYMSPGRKSKQKGKLRREPSDQM